MASWLNRGKGFDPRKSYMARSPLRHNGTRTLVRLGRKGREWAKERRRLKCEFVGRGITTCELRLPGCMVDNDLGFAHALKRRHITTLSGLRRVILACNHCHDIIELNGEAKMCRVVDAIIAKRGQQ